jgi:hypothetical protein
LFNLKFVALDKQGRYGCCSIRGRERRDGTGAETTSNTGLGFSVHDSDGHRVEPGVALLPPMTQEELDSIPWR